MHQEENYMEKRINFCLRNSVNFCAKQLFIVSGNNNVIGRMSPPKQTNPKCSHTNPQKLCTQLGKMAKGNNYRCTRLTLLIS